MVEKANVLFISFDDAIAPWPYKTLFGEPLKIPNLDEICSVSTAFSAAYCPATVCNPARSSFMSGKTTHQLGVFANKDNVFERHDPQIMWPYRLKENGYFCSSGGKVHHGHAPLPKQVHDVLYADEQKDFAYRLQRPVQTVSFGGYKDGLATVSDEDDDLFYDTRSADSAIAFLKSYDDDGPFYREVGFHSPHVPFATPARFKEMYDLRRIRQPEDWASGYDSNSYADEKFPKNPALERGRTHWWKKSVRNYFSAYSLVDDQLGRVWRALKASKHADNTIVVILADHGFHLGNKDRLQKSTLWEQVAHVPLIIHLPGAAARDVKDPISMIDIGPTILDLLGLGEIADSVGRSLRPYLHGEGRDVQTVPTFFFDNVSIRKDDYRLIRYGDGTTQLYDLTDDYWQLQDLGRTHPAFPGLYAELVKTSAAWGLEIRDGANSHANPAADSGSGTQRN